MARHNNEETSASQEYIRQSTALRQAFQSTEPLSHPSDPRLQQLKQVKDWFVNWLEQLRITYLDKPMRANGFVAWQTFDSVCLAINELCALIDYFSEPQFQEKHGRGAFIIPKWISQDIVESYFSYSDLVAAEIQT